MAIARRALAALTSLVAPPRCGACGEGCGLDEPVCARCAAELRRGPGRFLSVPAVDVAWSACPYDGAARRLVAALKFSGRLPLADAAAETMAAMLPPGLAAGPLVPVPPAPARQRSRGFDPTALIAQALAARLALPLGPCLARRDGPRQVGRPRRTRLDDPPRISAAQPASPAVTLVDDVTTTGATLSACALALRAAGAGRIVALTFAWTKGFAQAPTWA